jgi:hypothetical protein
MYQKLTTKVGHFSFTPFMIITRPVEPREWSARAIIYAGIKQVTKTGIRAQEGKDPFEEMLLPGWKSISWITSGCEINDGTDSLAGHGAKGSDRILQVLHQCRKGVLGLIEVTRLQGAAQGCQVST